MVSKIVGDSVSPLRPWNSLDTTLETGGASETNLPTSLLIESDIDEAMVSDKALTDPLPTASAMTDARFSDVLLNPVKSLDGESDMVGLSASPLNPVRSLLAASEI